MAANPIPWLVIIVATTAFQAIVYSDAYQETNFADLGDEPTGDEGVDGFFDIVGQVFSTIWNIIVLFVTFLVYPLDGGPTFLRVVLGFINGGVITWAIATLLRGS